jgi:hypothetical protein
MINCSYVINSCVIDSCMTALSRGDANLCAGTVERLLENLREEQEEQEERRLCDTASLFGHYECAELITVI